MSHGSNSNDPSGGVVSTRTMEMAVALALMVVGAIVMIASLRLGAGWSPSIGPQSGYFPFYVSLIMFLASGAMPLARYRAAGLVVGILASVWVVYTRYVKRYW